MLIQGSWHLGRVVLDFKTGGGLYLFVCLFFKIVDQVENEQSEMAEGLLRRAQKGGMGPHKHPGGEMCPEGGG